MPELKLRSRLKAVLAERRMQQKELAGRLGVTTQTTWRWTTDEGMSRASVATLGRISRAVGCDPWELVDFEEGDGDE